MIAFVKGMVAAVTEETVIVDVNGIGYELYCSGTALRSAQIGERISLHTYLQVKEDGVTLFGFFTEQEKRLFLKLLSVSGVGPKSAVSVLVCMSADELVEAVATADAKRLAKVKGLGKKTAARQNFRSRGYGRKRRACKAHGERNETFQRGRGCGGYLAKPRLYEK